MLCESNEGTISFSYATYTDICHHLCYHGYQCCPSDGAVVQHLVSFLFTSFVCDGCEQAGLLLFSSSVYYSAQEHMVHKLLQVPGMQA
jgi:hypothetical protein